MMKCLFYLILFICLAGSVVGQQVIIDSLTVPIEGDSTAYFMLSIFYDASDIDSSLVYQFGYRRLGRELWAGSFAFGDTAGVGVVRAAIIRTIDPYDVSRDGRVSILDVALLLQRLFLQ